MGLTHVDVSARLEEESARLEHALGIELGGESLELPSFPDVALRVRKALGHADIPLDDVVRMVGAEPSLAVRLLQLANSAALNPGGRRITSLRIAIARIGFDMARSATIAFAMSQMRRAEAWRGLECNFRVLWEAAVELAVTGHVVAMRARPAIADQAMLAGMVHVVGRLFVLTRISRFPLLLGAAEHRATLEARWHVRATRAILDRWELGDEIVDAACEFEDPGEVHEGVADLRDVLFVAHELGSLSRTLPGRDLALDPTILDLGAFQRLRLDAGHCVEILTDAAGERASLRSALLE